MPISQNTSEKISKISGKGDTTIILPNFSRSYFERIDCSFFAGVGIDVSFS